MHKLLLAAVFTGAIALMTLPAQAFPVSPISSAGTSSDIVQVRGGCGRGWHRGPYGGCRRNWARGRYVVPRRYVGPRCWFKPTPWGPRRVCRW